MLDLNYTALLKQAQTCLRNRDIVRAARICEDLHNQRKKDPNVLSLMSRIAVEQMRNDDAVKLLERCLAAEPKVLRHHLDLAWVLGRMGRHSQAVARLERARRLNPDDPHVISLLADSYERAGEHDKARSLLAAPIQSGQETPAMAMVWAQIALNDKNPGESRRILERHIAGPAYPSGFWFVAGQTYERVNETERAFNAYCLANKQPSLSFNLDEHIARYEQLMRHFTRRTLARLPKPQHDTHKPIFIAGRPRSGTTLVEKILDSHPDVAGVGELPHLPPVLENLGFTIGSTQTYPACIGDLDRDDVTRFSSEYLQHVQRLAPDARRTVDKNLANYEMLGPFQILFPESRVIHIRRDAVDNCWAIFVADMNYAWCADLRTLGVTHGLYEGLMTHWRSVLDLPVLEVDYEAVVDDQEGWTRKILEFCGLPWDERCLRYYEFASKNKDTISAPTLSQNQVRQPIYKTSVGRAQKFDMYLGPLREGLAEGRRIAAQLNQAAG